MIKLLAIGLSTTVMLGGCAHIHLGLSFPLGPFGSVGVGVSGNGTISGSVGVGVGPAVISVGGAGELPRQKSVEPKEAATQ
jgi:hypothetical protein